MVQHIREVAKDAGGTTSMEYSLIAALVGIGILSALQLLFKDGVAGLYGGSMARLLNAMGY